MQKTVQDGLLHYKNNFTAADLIKKRATQFSWHNAATDYLNIYRSLY